jgi:hypothetical protein
MGVGRVLERVCGQALSLMKAAGSRKECTTGAGATAWLGCADGLEEAGSAAARAPNPVRIRAHMRAVRFLVISGSPFPKGGGMMLRRLVQPSLQFYINRSTNPNKYRAIKRRIGARVMPRSPLGLAASLILSVKSPSSLGNAKRLLKYAASLSPG